MNVLIVDDDPLLLGLMRDFVTRLGFSVIACPGVESAEISLRQRHFDVVITDWQMPGGGGQRIANAVESILPRAALVIVTGAPSELPEATLALTTEVIEKPSMFVPLRRFFEQFNLNRNSPIGGSHSLAG